MASPLSNATLLQTSELSEMLGGEQRHRIVPVFVGSYDAFSHGHIPGSAHIEPAQLVCGMAPAVGKIPEPEDLAALFSNIGLNQDSIVIAYDDEGGGWAGRLIWTLDVIGHAHYHFLDGGITAWRADRLAVEQGPSKQEKSQYPVDIDQSQLVTSDSIVEQLGEPDFAIWDARSAQEHSGSKVLAARGGRIPGAKNLDWLDLMDRSNALRLKPLDHIEKMLEERGIRCSQQIVTHCQTHHRSGLSYLVGKLLGFNIKAYDGSWSEWGNLPDTPIESDYH